MLLLKEFSMPIIKTKKLKLVSFYSEKKIIVEFISNNRYKLNSDDWMKDVVY